MMNELSCPICYQIFGHAPGCPVAAEEDGCGNDPHPYDFTPIPRDMPIIDMDNIEEIPL